MKRIDPPAAPEPTSAPMQGPGGLIASQISHAVDGGIAWHVWRGSRYLGRVIDRTPYPRDERVSSALYDFRSQAYMRGLYDEETPNLYTFDEALNFFA